MVEALVVLIVAGSVAVLGTVVLLGTQRPAEDDPDQPRRMHELPPVPPSRPRTPEPAVFPLPPAPRPVRRCGHCRMHGHTRALCPRLTGLQVLPGLAGPPEPVARRLLVGHSGRIVLLDPCREPLDGGMRADLLEAGGAEHGRDWIATHRRGARRTSA